MIEHAPQNAMTEPEERHMEFGGRRPYRFVDARHARSRRWELWMDADQAAAVTRCCA